MNNVSRMIREMERERITAIKLLNKSEKLIKSASILIKHASTLKDEADQHRLAYELLKEQLEKPKEEQNASDHV